MTNRNKNKGFTPLEIEAKGDIKKSLTGFTFIELLIALTIFSIIATGIYYTLNAGTVIWRRANVQIGENQKIRVFFNTISRDLRNAISFSGVSSEWTEDSVSFHTIADVSSAEETHRELVRRI